MLRKLSGSLAALMLVAVWSLAVNAAPASAQAVFADDAPTNDGEARVNSAYTASITVSAPYTVTSIEAMTQVAAANNHKFFIMDANTLTSVYVSPPKAFAADAGPATYKQSDLFAAVTLQPGKTYYIGAIVDRNTYYPFRFPAAAVTQGVVTNAALAGSGNATNGVVNSYANPTIAFGGLAQSPIRLNTIAVPAPASVPTMTEWAMILLAVMLAGSAAVMIQRRRTAPDRRIHSD